MAAHELQSGGIVEMLDGLWDKFEKQLLEVEAQETPTAQHYDLYKVRVSDMSLHSQKNHDEMAADENTIAEMLSAHE